MEVSKDIYLSIVIPVYKSEKILPDLLFQIKNSLLELPFEVIFVCDSSPDNSWQVIKKLSAEYQFVRGVLLRKNSGQHNATMAGLNFCNSKFIVIMDDDLQHPPASIRSILHKLESGADVCYTKYRNRQHEGWKIIGSKFNDWVANILLGKPKGLYLSSFKGLSKGVAEQVIKYDGPFAYVDGLILDCTNSVVSIEIDHQKRFEGEGNYNLRKSLSLWLKMATSFSVFPLRILFILGTSIAVLSLFIIIYVIIAKLMHPEMPAGWASLIAAIFFVGGLQLLGLGLIGEYLGRSYLKMNKKPQFVVKEVV